MQKKGLDSFPHYHVGINSLAEVATKEDRICVLNIIGSESRAVTPTSHAYSGGNIVFGTMPGRSGQVLPTPIGDIPVFNNVSEGFDQGYSFNTAVIYLPPKAVRDAVAEVSRVNPDLKKVVIITEKVPVKDARIIRAISQMREFDMFGANSLGVADSHNNVRIGGALGGTHPTESLVPGSIAIYSNSGNFTTTIAVYLLSQGWGTTTSISSGKDVYIYFAAAEFINAFENDDRSKAAVMYIEPGGYYEQNLKFNKPIITCVVGRWKARLTKAVGHAGSLAGSGDDAKAKERWFMDYFGVDELFTPENPVFSKKGAVVINIAHIPEALSKVMEANGIQSDFESKGNLSKKVWFCNNQSLLLPPSLDLDVVRAMEPYDLQIEASNKQVGAIFPRQTLKDASGASRMDPKTQITNIHNVSVLKATSHSIAENAVLGIIREYPTGEGAKFANLVLNAFVNLYGDPILATAGASREAGNSPNTVLASALGLMGRKRVEKAQSAVNAFINVFQHSSLNDPFKDEIDLEKLVKNVDRKAFFQKEEDKKSDLIFQAIKRLKIRSVFIDLLNKLAEGEKEHIGSDVLLAAITTSIGWNPLRRKVISKITLVNMPWHFKIFSSLVGASAAPGNHAADSFCGVKTEELFSDWGFGETAFLALMGKRPTEMELFNFNVIIGLVITNGPGTISAQGAKGAVSADGPEEYGRVQVNKAFQGFLTHTGFAHGGNGYEAIAFLVEQFRNTGLKDPGDKNHGLDLAGIAEKYAEDYKNYKKQQKEVGNISYAKIPCVNHPVFKGQDVNLDPREVFVSKLFEEKGMYNIFLEFYHELVVALFKAGASKNVYCVNVDAVIAVIILKILWEPFNKGETKEEDLETTAFTVFLFGRMIGSAAEIEDHINRGRNMDTRTQASLCKFVE